MNIIKKIFGHSDTKQREDSEVDQALTFLEGVAKNMGMSSAQEFLDETERLVLASKAEWVVKRSGCAPFTTYGSNAQQTRFAVPQAVAWSLDPLSDYLTEAGVAFNRADNGASIVLYNQAMLDIPHTERPSKWDLLEAEAAAASRAAHAEEDDEDHSDDDDDEDDTVGITGARYRQLLAIERAANQVLNYVEYRVNHVFKGDSKSYYVRFDDLNALKAAVEDR